MRKTDIVARHGGGFVVAMPDTRLPAASRKLDDVRILIGTTLIPIPGGNAVTVTISAGLAEYPTQGSSDDELLAVADERLFQAKAGGRNRVIDRSS